MRRTLYFVMAMALVLGFTQCKKEQPTPQTQGVRITLNVNGGNSNSRVIVDPAGAEGYATVAFEDDDVIYVGYNNAYVGTLTYSNGTFDGTVNISEIVGDEHLHFYFLGGVGFEPTIDGNTATVIISDQTTKYPVISYSPSKESFTGEGAYSAKLQNKVSIMKFNVNTPSTAPICITGMNNKVTVDFTAPNGTDNGFAYDKEGVGLIEMPAKGANNETWAIVLPQEALTEGNEGTAFTYDGYKGNRPALEAIASNQYITTVVDDLDVSTFDINYMPLTFEAKAAGSRVTFTASSSIPDTDITMQYNMYDGEGWKPYTSGTNIDLLSIGDKVSFRGDNNTLGYYYGSSNFSSTGQCYIYGNIMSLLSSTNYATATTLTGDCTFFALFQYNSHIYSHSSKALVLPATTLSSNCYTFMFNGCSQLTSAPERLPAMTLTYGCYANMFQDCSRLASTPELPATTLAQSCYSSMFAGCSLNLTEAPQLLATTLAPYCYSNMFNGCMKLTSAPAQLPAETLAEHCYEEMFHGCSLTSAPALPATTLAPYCYSCMFYTCSKLTSAPNLPAETLADHCYSNMFNGCYKLISAPALPATTLAPYCYSNMFNGCSGLTSAPVLSATTLAEYCYEGMFQLAGEAPFFRVPDLPAPTLVEGCYKRMFSGCDINYIKCLATNISATDCTTEWVANFMNFNGTFVTPSSTAWTIGDDGIPSGWTRVNAN